MVVAVLNALVGEALSFGDGASLTALVLGMLAFGLIDLCRTRSPR